MTTEQLFLRLTFPIPAVNDGKSSIVSLDPNITFQRGKPAEFKINGASITKSKNRDKPIPVYQRANFIFWSTVSFIPALYLQT